MPATTLEQPTPRPDLIVVECDSFAVSRHGDRIMVELRGAIPNPDLPPHRHYLTQQQIAERLGTSKRTIRKMMHQSNPIPFVRFGGTPRFVEEEVFAWAKAGASMAARRARVHYLGVPKMMEVLSRPPKRRRKKKD